MGADPKLDRIVRALATLERRKLNVKAVNGEISDDFLAERSKRIADGVRLIERGNCKPNKDGTYTFESTSDPSASYTVRNFECLCKYATANQQTDRPSRQCKHMLAAWFHYSAARRLNDEEAEFSRLQEQEQEMRTAINTVRPTLAIRILNEKGAWFLVVFPVCLMARERFDEYLRASRAAGFGFRRFVAPGGELKAQALRLEKGIGDRVVIPFVKTLQEDGLQAGFRFRLEGDTAQRLPALAAIVKPSEWAASNPAEQWILQGILTVDAANPDFARIRNAVGFNASDSAAGRDLANKIRTNGVLSEEEWSEARDLALHYRKQIVAAGFALPPELEAQLQGRAKAKQARQAQERSKRSQEEIDADSEALH
jgi:hypothetical protein